MLPCGPGPFRIQRRRRMQSPASGIGLIALGLYSCLACNRSEPTSEGKASPTASVTPSVAAAVPVTAAAAQPASTSTATAKGVCPFPRRCDEACKKAHFVATDKCAPQWKEVEKAVPSVNEMGACTAACLKTPNNTGCVGAATKEECACTDKCTGGSFPPALRAKGDAYLSCYATAVAGACY
jgi:hypothetical protein